MPLPPRRCQVVTVWKCLLSTPGSGTTIIPRAVNSHQPIVANVTRRQCPPLLQALGQRCTLTLFPLLFCLCSGPGNTVPLPKELSPPHRHPPEQALLSHSPELSRSEVMTYPGVTAKAGMRLPGYPVASQDTCGANNSNQKGVMGTYHRSGLSVLFSMLNCSISGPT